MIFKPIACGIILAAAAAISMPASALEVGPFNDHPVDLGAYAGPTDLMQTMFSDKLDFFDADGLGADSTLEVVAVFDGALVHKDIMTAPTIAIDLIDNDVFGLDADSIQERVAVFDGGVLVEIFPLDPQAPEVASLDIDSGDRGATAAKAAGDV